MIAVDVMGFISVELVWRCLLAGMFPPDCFYQTVQRIIFIQGMWFYQCVIKENGLLRIITYSGNITHRVIGILQVLQYIGAVVAGGQLPGQAPGLFIIIVPGGSIVAINNAYTLPFGI